ALISQRHGLEDAIPYTDFPPTPEPIGAGSRWTISLGDISPGRARPKPPIDAIQHLAVIHSRHASRLIRQQRLDDRPFAGGQFVAAWDQRGASQPLESPRLASNQDLLGSWPRLVCDDGPRIELPVSVPRPTAPKLAATAAAVPPLEPAG